MNEIERTVLEGIDEGKLVRTLCDLVDARSDGGRESEAQRRVAAALESAGLDTDVWELDFASLLDHPACSTEIDRDEGLGVVGLLGGDPGGRSLILNGHVDVVPAGNPESWSVPPWRGTVRDRAVFGRGTVDMKGALSAAIEAARAIAGSGVRLRGALLIESVIGEEDGGIGTLAAILRGHTADAAVVMEPTGLAVAPAQAGALNFRVEVRGRAAHGALRDEGVSAIDAFLPVYRALQELEARRNRTVEDPLFRRYSLPYPICVGTIRGGEWASSVPEAVSFEGRYGIAVGEDLHEARAMLEGAVAGAAEDSPWLRSHPPAVTWWGGRFPPARTDENHAIVRTLMDAHSDLLGRRPRVEGMPFGSDMGLLVNVARIPTVLFGPGDIRNAHRPDEHVAVADLLSAARILALAALRFCGYEGGAAPP